MARVQILKETTLDKPGDWRLWLQWCRYDLDDDEKLFGYRFIYRTREGSLQAARGQARIPSFATARDLMAKATAEGWGDRDGESIEAAVEKLERHGCVVTLASGYVGWPNKEAALQGNMTQELIDAARIIREWS